jgi:hypothetical protein
MRADFTGLGAVSKQTGKGKIRKCRSCSESFRASTGRQIYCKRPACLQERRLQYRVEYMPRWRKKHPGYWQNYLRKWRREHPEYFKEWRRKNPDYFKNWYRRRKAAMIKAKAR